MTYNQFFKIEANTQINEILELSEKDLITMSNMLNWIMEKTDKMNDKMENFKIFEIYKNNQISNLKQNYENEN